MLKYRFLPLIAVCLFWTSVAQGQDVLRKHKITALKGLEDIYIVLRPNVMTEVISQREIVDTCELNLRQRLPELRIRKKIENARNWLELSYITTQHGGFVEISLYRWVKVITTGEDVFTSVWNDKKVIFGSVDRGSLRDAIETILVSFAVDFMRANQKKEEN